MIITFIGSQAGMTNFQRDELKKVLDLKKCSEFCHNDSLGSTEQANGLALDAGIKIYSIFPLDNPRKRAFMFDPKKLTGHLRTNTNFIERDGLQVRWMAIEPYFEGAKRMVDAAEAVIACPKEFKFTVQSATWKVIQYVWKTKKDIVVIPPVERPEV